MDRTQAVDPNRTMMGTGPSLNTTVTIKPVQCPVCKAFNPAGMMYCSDCGLIFEFALDGDAFGAPVVRLPVLVEENGREHPVRPGVNLVGRRGDIALEDPRVSRQHAQITSSDGQFWIEDLGSTNGTKASGVTVAVGQKSEFKPGETLSFGGLEVTLAEPGQQNATHMPVGGSTRAMDAPLVGTGPVAYIVTTSGEIALKEGTQSFGRREGNDVVLNDPYVSGSHGTIEASSDGVFLTDTGSSNGTAVNGAKLAVGQRTQLTPDDVVTIGQFEFTIRFAEA